MAVTYRIPVNGEGKLYRNEHTEGHQPGHRYPLSLILVLEKGSGAGRRRVLVQKRSEKDPILGKKELPFLTEGGERTDVDYDFITGQPYDGKVSDNGFYRNVGARGLKEEGGIILTDPAQLRDLKELHRGRIDVGKPYTFFGVLYGFLHDPEVHGMIGGGDIAEGVRIKYANLSNRMIKKILKPYGPEAVIVAKRIIEFIKGHEASQKQNNRRNNPRNNDSDLEEELKQTA